MAGQTKSKTPKTEEDDTSRQQPAWRQPPPKPRKRARTNTFAASRPAGSKAAAKQPNRAFVAPSREALLAWLRVGALITAVIVIVVGLLYLLRWPLLQVGPGSTFIGGAQRIDPTHIYEQSGAAGRNILALRADEIEAQLRQVPGVGKVTVHLRLPNQVIIDVVEHAPLVAWQSITATVWLAADGSEVPQAGALPELKLIDQSDGRLLTDKALKALTLDNLKILRAAQPALTELSYGNTQGLYYRAAEGWEVWLGERGGMAEKVALAAATGREIAATGAPPKVIDVRHSDKKAMWW